MNRLALLAALLAPINAEDNAAARIAFDCEGVAIEATAATDTAAARNSVEILAYNGGELRVPGYDAPVVVDLDGVSGFGRSIPLLRDHDPKRIVGQVVPKRVGNKIQASGKLVGASSDRAEVAELAADGFAWQASIGVRPTSVERVAAGKSVTVNGSAVQGPAYVARKSRIAELTLCTIGADAETDVAIAAADEGGTGGAGQSGAPVNGSAALARLAAERARVEAIEAAALAAGQGNTVANINAIQELMENAITAGDSPQQFELQLLRNVQRPQGRIAGGGGNQLQGRDLHQAVEASLLLTLGNGRDVLEKHYDERILNAMDANHDLRHGVGLCDLLCMAAEANTRQRVSRRDIDAMLHGAFAPINANGLSTFNLSGIFSNVANKSLRMAFDSVEQSWAEIASIGTARDFREMTSYSLTGDMTYDRVAPGGELKHGTVGEQSYTNQADTYGKMFSLDRRDIINDDLNAFESIMRKLGRGGALKLNDVFWAEFLADHGSAPYFHSSSNNAVIGSGSAPWYLLASPADLPFIQVVFLNGRQQPTVERADADFKQLGIQFRGYHDFGVNKQEARAAVKSANALTIDELAAAEKVFLDQKDYDSKPLAIRPSILLTATGNKVAAANIYNSTVIVTGNTNKNPANNPFAGAFRPVYSAYLPNS